ncbi:MAG: T9SS type A sorting domain-containing protein, partial [Melioribacteraceae bacterium]|nr:T9SS type A sorting domain-containing protein [Melioribacteraceae bacterium]
TESPNVTGNITVKGNLTLNFQITVDGKLTLNGGNIVMSAVGNQVTLLGDFEEKAGEWFTTAAGTVVLGGANNAEFKLSTNQIVDANSKITLNKTNDNSVVTLVGANLDFATTPIDLTLTKGVFETDATSKIILKQSLNLSNQPTQGYSRVSGVIAGNVEKFIDKTTTIDISKVEYPTGDASGNYRPAIFYFKTSPQSSINLLVNPDDASPGGTTGLPMTLASQTITNYPDFSWKVLSDLSLAPSYKFDVEFQAEGYSDYVLDGIGNVRLIRRGHGNTANPWVLQGLEANYDNSTIAADHPLVKVIDATGGITSQGALFTYSQSNKPPVVDKVAEVNSVSTPIVADAITIAEDVDTLVVDYTITDPDIGDNADDVTAVVPTGAVWDDVAQTVTWTPGFADEGDHLIIITATDTYAQSTIDTLTVTVTNTNQLPYFTAAPADSVEIGEGQEYNFTYVAADDDVDNDSLRYVILSNVGTAPDSISLDAVTGELVMIPSFGQMGDTFDLTVRVTDGEGGTTDTLSTFTVGDVNRAPVVDTPMPDTTVAENSLLTLDFGPNASDPDGDPLTFTHTLLMGGVVVDSADHGAMTATGVYTWTPSFTQAGTYVLVANVSDGDLSADDSVTVVVNDVNSPPVFTVVLPDTTIFVGDQLTFKYVAEDLDMDALTFSLATPNPQTLSIVSQDDTSATIGWTPVVTDTAVYILRMFVTDNQAWDTTTAIVVVQVTTVDINGVVSYNVSAELLDAVTVTLSDGVNQWTDVTDATGAYSFTDVTSGEYTITAAKTTQWGGALASDALETQLYVVNPDSNFLNSDLQKVAADVVGVGNITSSDALAILNRSVGIDDFQIDDWQFETAAVTAGTQDITQNLMGIAAGDARSDYSPALGLAKVSNIAVNSDEVLNIKKESEFELPISITELTEIGSFTFKLKYDLEKVEFLGISTENGGTLVANVVEDVISIAWVNLGSKDINVKDGDALATLKFKATDKFGKADEVSLELLDGAEMTDRMAKNINAGIKIPVVAIGIPDVFALRQNYPNPFNPSTTIQYDLPENGKVTLTVYNSLGQRVGTLVNTKQVAGAYEVNFNASNLASGVYLYRVTVEGSKNFVMTKKMILMK